MTLGRLAAVTLGRFAAVTCGRLAAVTLGSLALGTAACGSLGAGPVQPAAPPGSALTAPPPAVAAAAPLPTMEGPCPYLDRRTVEQTNGQRVGSVRISTDRPYPACFFYRGNGAEQLRTWIVVATPQVAGATVDAAAPVATSDRAELPGGWSGGSQPTSTGAVFAVARQGTAVVITTNQKQTIDARRVAEQVIAALGW
ncbi:MAG TPA: DUF2020 domain-containing protein [Pseudonocardiaceae bacterium]|nr:DUF2020 domain-containing protein [Pseudonocardiaceae bacterium]